MKQKFMNFLVVAFFLCMPNISTAKVNFGEYAYEGQGHEGIMLLIPAQEAEGALEVIIKTHRTDNYNACLVEALCQTQGESLVCSDPKMPEVNFTLDILSDGVQVVGDGANYGCGARTFATGKYTFKPLK